MPKAQRTRLDEETSRIDEYSEPPDPSERLKQLEHELKEHNSHIARLQKQAGALQTDITDLQTTVKQVEASVTTYGGALKDLHNRLHALHYFNEQKSKMIHAAIGEKKGEIDELIKNFDIEIVRMEERSSELREALNTAQRESDEAAQSQAERQKEYDELNNFQQTLSSNLGDLETLRGQITQADDKTDVATMYFLMSEFHKISAQTKIIPQHQLSVELRQKLGELEAAKEYARAKSAALSNAQADHTNQETALKTKQANRRTTLLADVQKKFPVPPASSVPGALTQPETGTASQGSGSPASAAISTPPAASTTPGSTASQQK
ncbi:MAG: hypothetical protein JO340_03580 [Acidobacteriaceae bacterium]|nr:hypothetical protein [Acidobacteriaceae bacterium]